MQVSWTTCVARCQVPVSKRAWWFSAQDNWLPPLSQDEIIHVNGSDTWIMDYTGIEKNDLVKSYESRLSPKISWTKWTNSNFVLVKEISVYPINAVPTS